MIENIVIVMPAYNAGATIEKVFARIPAAVVARVKKYIVVDDGSTDGTAKALSRLSSVMANMMVLNHEQNRGYGATEKTLLRAAMSEEVDVAILLHSDGQYAPEKIPELLESFDQGGVDLVQGSRMLGGGARKGGMPLYKYIANKCLTMIENRGFGMKMAEYHSGYMLYSRKLLEAIPFEKLSDSFDFDLEMIVCAHILNRPIREIAIPTRYADEKSHLNPIKYGLDVLDVVKRYKDGYYHRLLGKEADNDSD